MDTLRSVEGGDPYDHDYRDDETADTPPPPSIGTDERRMHVRAYNYWVSLLGSRVYPGVAALDPAGHADFGPHSVLLDFTQGAGHPTIGYLGALLRTECGLDGDQVGLDVVPSRSLLSRLTDHYLQIIANRAPIGFEAEFVNQRGRNTLYRGILMPFSSDDETIDFIYGVINWKELVDSDTAAAIEVEITDAMRDVKLSVAPGPVWADGPRADPAGLEIPAASAPDAQEDIVPDNEAPLGDDAGLADRLAVARDTADALRGADARSRDALYRALGLAYDFARDAEQHPDDYAELLADAGVRAQSRAPMTPVVKLVFGADYDKSRLTEFAAVLSHAKRHGVASGALAERLAGHPGGLKAIVAEERRTRRPTALPVGFALESAKAALHRAPALATLDLPSEDADFVLLIARREPDGRLAVLTPVPADDRLLERAIRTVAR